MSKQGKISIQYSHKEYLDQVERTRESNRLLLEKVKNDYELFRKTLRSDLGIPLKEESTLRKVI